jgi:hypothetical protein
MSDDRASTIDDPWSTPRQSFWACDCSRARRISTTTSSIIDRATWTAFLTRKTIERTSRRLLKDDEAAAPPDTRPRHSYGLTADAYWFRLAASGGAPFLAVKALARAGGPRSLFQCPA